MKKLTKKSLDEMAKTMNVIPDDDRENYWGMYGGDCFWRCVAYLATGSSSETTAASFAESFWYSELGYYQGTNHLSVHGGEMSMSDISAYKSYNAGSIDLSSVCIYTTGNNEKHAVICTGSQVAQLIPGYAKSTTTVYTYFDPSTGQTYTSLVNYQKLQ